MPGNLRKAVRPLRNIPKWLDRPNSVVTERERLAMKKIKVHSLTGRITPKLMRQAFQAVKRNRGAAGADKVSIKMFAANLEENLTALMRDIVTILTLQQSLQQILGPAFALTIPLFVFGKLLCDCVEKLFAN